jgi:hypothetical protein
MKSTKEIANFAKLWIATAHPKVQRALKYNPAAKSGAGTEGKDESTAATHAEDGRGTSKKKQEDVDEEDEEDEEEEEEKGTSETFTAKGLSSPPSFLLFPPPTLICRKT